MLTAGTFDNNGLPDNWIYSGLSSGKASSECHSGFHKQPSQDELTEQENLLEMISEPSNLRATLKELDNNGSPGIDGMGIDVLRRWTEKDFISLSRELLSGTYQPNKARYARIPKEDGTTRQLSIPTVTDRLVQRAIIRQIGPAIDQTFSPSSFGFRTGKNQHQAIHQVSRAIGQGYKWLIKIDLEKFFDTVNQDMIISKLEKIIKDRRLTRLIRQYMITFSIADENGIRKGVPQGGPLSPFLSNFLLDGLDQEMERRGMSFARYADDVLILTKSKKAAERTTKSITRFIQEKLKLKVNGDKTQIARPGHTEFLGFKFTRSGRIDISHRNEKKLTDKIKAGMLKDSDPQEKKIREKGWLNYFVLVGNTKRMKRCRYRLRRVTIKDKA